MKCKISFLMIFFIVVFISSGILADAETSRRLTRDEAKNILISRNLVISIDWCAFPGKCRDKTFHLQNPYGFFLEGSDAGIKVSRETLSSYLSCLESRNLVRYTGKTKGSKGSFTWGSWLETTGSGEPYHLTEIGQKSLSNNMQFELSLNIDKITGIQFKEEDTVAKVFFDATIKNSDNPFNQCFKDYFDIQSLLNEPYAMFELFDDGWRFKKWNSGGSLKQKEKTSKKELKEREIHSEEPLRKEITLEAALRLERERIDSMEKFKKQKVISLRAEGVKHYKNRDWNAAIKTYKSLLEIDPENYEANANIGGTYAMLNEFDLSIQCLSKASQLIPIAPDPYIIMIYTYARKGDKDRAIESLQDALNRGFKNVTHLKKDTELPEDFRQDPRFKELTKLTLAELTVGVKDANLFEDHFKEFSYHYDDVWAAVDYALKDQDEKIIQSDKETGIIVTDITRHGFIGFPRYEKYYILIEKVNGGSTKLSLKLFVYARDMKGKGLKELILIPETKSYANERAEKFIEKIRETLKKREKSTILQLKRLWSSSNTEENITVIMR